MADTICIALSAKNQHNSNCSDSGRGWFFALSSEKLQWKTTRKGKYFINNIIYKKADQMICPIQQKLFLGRCYS